MKKLFLTIAAIATIGSLCLFTACSGNTNDTNNSSDKEKNGAETTEKYKTNEFGVELIPCDVAMQERKDQHNIIEKDLIGRTISYNYYGKQGNWIIEGGEIKNLQITSCKRNGDEFLMELTFMLHSVGADYNANIEANYIFDETKGWTIEYVNLLPNGWSVVETGKYKKFISKEITKGWSGAVYLRNTSDMQLMVYGYTHSSYGGDWEPFQLQVPANDRAHLSFDERIEVQIDMVERP